MQILIVTGKTFEERAIELSVGLRDEYQVTTVSDISMDPTIATVDRLVDEVRSVEPNWIIAIGGGGLGRNPNQPIIEKYILDQSPAEKPNVCFIPTASAEDSAYIVNFYTAFSRLHCSPLHINFFQRTPRLDSIINKQDIIYWERMFH